MDELRTRAVVDFWSGHCPRASVDPDQRGDVFAFGNTPEMADRLGALVVTGPKRDACRPYRQPGSHAGRSVQALPQQVSMVRVACSLHDDHPPRQGDGADTVATLTDSGVALVTAAAPGHVDAVRHHLIEPLTTAQLRTVAAVGGRIRSRFGGRADTAAATRADRNRAHGIAAGGARRVRADPTAVPARGN